MKATLNKNFHKSLLWILILHFGQYYTSLLLTPSPCIEKNVVQWKLPSSTHYYSPANKKIRVYLPINLPNRWVGIIACGVFPASSDWGGNNSIDFPRFKWWEKDTLLCLTKKDNTIPAGSRRQTLSVFCRVRCYHRRSPPPRKKAQNPLRI